MRLLNFAVCCFTILAAFEASACKVSVIRPMQTEEVKQLMKKNNSGLLTKDDQLLLDEYNADLKTVVAAEKTTEPFCTNLTKKQLKQKSEDKDLANRNSMNCGHLECDDLAEEQLSKAPYNEGRYRYITPWEERAEANMAIAQITNKWTNRKTAKGVQ